MSTAGVNISSLNPTFLVFTISLTWGEGLEFWRLKTFNIYHSNTIIQSNHTHTRTQSQPPHPFHSKYQITNRLSVIQCAPTPPPPISILN